MIMSISSDKVRISLVIDKEDKAKLEEIAKADDRTLSYIVNKAIKEYLQSNT